MACHSAAHIGVVCGIFVIVQLQRIVHILAFHGQLVDNGIIIGIRRCFQHRSGQEIRCGLAEVCHQRCFHRVDGVLVCRCKVGIGSICGSIAHAEAVVAAIGEMQCDCDRLGIVQPEFFQIGAVFFYYPVGFHRSGIVGQCPQGGGIHRQIFPARHGICRMVISRAGALCRANHCKGTAAVGDVNRSHIVRVLRGQRNAFLAAVRRRHGRRILLRCIPQQEKRCSAQCCHQHHAADDSQCFFTHDVPPLTVPSADCNDHASHNNCQRNEEYHDQTDRFQLCCRCGDRSLCQVLGSNYDAVFLAADRV